MFELDAASPGVVSPETAWRLDEAYTQVEAQAASLGYAAPLRPRSASPLPQAPFLTPVQPGPALTDPIPKEPHHD